MRLDADNNSVIDKAVNKKIVSQLLYKKAVFYEKIERKLSKLIASFGYLTKGLTTRNLVFLCIYLSLFSEIAKFYFEVEYAKHLPLVGKNMVLENITFNNIQSIKKVGILMGGDNWKRAPLQDGHE